MAYKIACITNENKDSLIDFEQTIRKTEPEIWPSEFSEREYRRKLSERDFDNKNNLVLCAILDDKIIGRCDLIIQESFMDFTKTGYIDWIYVEKAYRGKGVGKLLIEKTVEKVKMLGAEYCYLFTAANEEAQAFYKSLGILELEKKEVAHKFLG
ncbi:GNAT family N-acetyltransferase [Acidaminobacter sp. JC074]|uniref:GNAT family N-acetyltransferase n=1 Tax=Acidaminobacter sp. JC074 TaxID=2530199 RepID=UPI001F0F3133|nr:GNAT family N-acetyltransferase [Acidaminobacter sp. JC074]MCH4886298.1 GNAT family N-acetyltransferase [Acidaminobacter sp. JC074]